MRRLRGTKWIQTRAAFVGILSVSLFSALSAARAQDPKANDAQSDDEEVFSLDGLGSAQDAGDGNGKSESSVWDSLTTNLRFNIDFVSRIEMSRRRGKPFALNTIGIDLHKVVSSKDRDIGTLLLQTYLVRRDNVLIIHTHVEDDDDWEVEFHQFWFNLTQWGKGRTNLRLGHMLMPYGLEPSTDTHFTVYQLITMQNLGAKMDWGLSLNGTMPSFDYEVAILQGSGMEYTNAGKNYAVVGRIGTPSDRNFILGLSGFYGQILDPHRIHRYQSRVAEPSRVDSALGRVPGEGRGDDNLVRRLRVGLDFTWIINQFTLKGETSVGRDFDQDVLNSLLELDWSTPDRKFAAYVQTIYLGQRGPKGWDEDVLMRIGGIWSMDENWSLSGQYTQDIKTYGTRREDALFTLQLRYRL